MQTLQCIELSRVVGGLQATLPLLKFRSGKPHYLWLPVHRRQSDKEVVTGEVHLRVQWTSDLVGQPAQSGPSWAFEVQLKGIGLSVIETLVLKFPREVPFLPLVKRFRCHSQSLHQSDLDSLGVGTKQMPRDFLQKRIRLDGTVWLTSSTKTEDCAAY